jgi:uncharacterized membrane protein
MNFTRLRRVWWWARGLLALHACFVLVAWPNLPSRIPTHFDRAGTPDAWSGPSFVSWFLLLSVSLGLHLLMMAVTVPAMRKYWNIPEKERFLQLTPEQQAPVVKLMQTFGGISALCLGTVMFALQVGTYLVAHGHLKTLHIYIYCAIFVPVGCMLLAMIPWFKAVRQAIVNPQTK